MNPASPEPPNPLAQTGLITQRPAGLVTLPHNSSPALSEIITRSLAHLRTSQSLATRHREPGEEREFEIAPGVMMRMCWIPPGEFLTGSQLVTTCHKLKITATAGKQRFCHAAIAETLLWLVQRVRSPKAAPINLWLAKVGYEDAILANIIGETR